MHACIKILSALSISAFKFHVQLESKAEAKVLGRTPSLQRIRN